MTAKTKKKSIIARALEAARKKIKKKKKKKELPDSIPGIVQ